MWFNLASRDSFERPLTHSQDVLSLPEARNKGDGVSQRENSKVFASVIPLWGCPHASAKTQQGAFTRASTSLQRYPITQVLAITRSSVGRSSSWEPLEKQTLTGNVTAAYHRTDLGKFPVLGIAFRSCWFEFKGSPHPLAFCLKFLFDLELSKYQIKWREHDKKKIVQWNNLQPFEGTSKKNQKKSQWLSAQWHKTKSCPIGDEIKTPRKPGSGGVWLCFTRFQGFPRTRKIYLDQEVFSAERRSLWFS